jgi:hypothetical protein
VSSEGKPWGWQVFMAPVLPAPKESSVGGDSCHRLKRLRHSVGWVPVIDSPDYFIHPGQTSAFAAHPENTVLLGGVIVSRYLNGT